MAQPLACGGDEHPPVQVVAAGGSAGSGGSGGTSGSAGFTPGPCVPTSPVCYGNREPTEVESGTECLAALDNSPGGSLERHVQWRHTWTRIVARGSMTNLWGPFAAIKAEECFANSARGGRIEIFDWDRSNPDPTRQTVTSGYANYSVAGSPPPPPLGELAANGLCFVEWDYTPAAAIAGNVSLTRWQGLHQPPLPQPWHVAPAVSKRVTQDFDVNAIRGTVPPTEGRIYIDETRGIVHGYIPFSYVVALADPTAAIAIPIRELEVRTHFNDDRFNCVGRYRAEPRSTGECSTADSTSNPQWGCKVDALCPPDPSNMEQVGWTMGPSFTTGYFLIVDLERVWSPDLESTLCVSLPGFEQSEIDGWSGSWGRNCRGSPKWNPDLENDAGLPMGDWCSRSNGPADTNCHDAYVHRVSSAGQAFKLRTATPPTTLPATAQNPWTGTCDVASGP